MYAVGVDGKRLLVYPATDAYLALSNKTISANALAVINDESFDKAGTTVLIYPNPTSGKASLRTGATTARELTIFNLLGQKVKTIKMNQNGETEIDFVAEPPGAYLVKWSDESGVH